MKKFTEIFLVAAALCVLPSITTAQQNKAEQMYQQVLYDMEAKGDYSKAIESFKQVMIKFPNEKATVAKALLNIGGCYEKLGNSEALKAYERILRDFKDQTQVVAEARARLALLKQQTEANAILSKRLNRQILEGTDANTEGAPSADGRYLSYTDNKINSLVIYELKTGEHTVLANPDSNRNDMFVNESIWSPDGKQLAYCLNDEAQRTEIHLINLDGTGYRTLCTKTETGGARVRVEDWSRDGQLILVLYNYFSTYGDVNRLGVISIADGATRFTKTIDHWNWKQHNNKMFFSPDGRFIAWSAPIEKGEKTCDVFVIDVDGSREINITQNPADDIVLGWAPNGNRLLFSSDRGGSQALWANQMVNGRPEGFPKLIWNNVGKIKSMGLINDGSLYYSFPRDTTIGPYYESNIYLAPLDSQNGKILTPPVAATMHNNGYNHLGVWLRDGKQLLYLSYLGNRYDSPRKYFIHSLETGFEKEVLRQITADSSFDDPNWFSDSKHLVTHDGNNGIFKWDTETGEMSPIITSTDTIYVSPRISPDGRIVFFQSTLGSIYAYDLERKERRILFQKNNNQRLRGFGLSSDGEHIAFMLITNGPKQSEAIMVIPSSGGEPRTIFQTDTTGFFSKYSNICWSPDGNYIYFAKKFEEEVMYELCRVPVHGGTQEPTGLVWEGLHWFTIRPDGKEIAFCAGIESKTGIWMLENVFNEKEEVGSGKK
jgi:Tol biopolymer transport system component